MTIERTMLDALIAEYYSDAGSGDRTTTALGLAGRQIEAALVAREDAVAACSDLAAALPAALGLDVAATDLCADGEALAPGALVARLHGNAAQILALERTLLNALQLLLGIARETRRWVSALPPGVRLLDTRKTHPGLRGLERRAVRAGGGYNHRFNLADAIMIKDNHIALVGAVGEAVRRAVALAPPGVRVQCEVESLAAAQEAVAAGAEALLVDNEPIEEWPLYWDTLPAHVVLEFSGGITFSDLARIPPPPRPVFVSSSQTVMAARPADIGLDIEAV